MAISFLTWIFEAFVLGTAGEKNGKKGKVRMVFAI
jgi:hypothetical protein